MAIEASSNKIITNLFFFFCLFPFVSPYPVGSDVQPIAGFFAIAVLFFKKRYEKADIILILFFLLFIFYFNPFYEFNHMKFSVGIMLPYGLLIALAARTSYECFSSRVFNASVLIYFIFTILTLMMPHEMIHLQGYVVRNVNTDTLSGLRGVSTFSTEPGLLAGLIVGMMLINDYFRQLLQISAKKYMYNTLMLLVVLFSTRSGTSILFIFIYLAFKIKWTLRKSLIVIAFVFLFIFLVYAVFPYLYNNFAIIHHSRASMILYYFITAPKLLLNDRSIMTRVISILILPWSLLSYPLGVGINGLPYAMKDIVISHSIFSNFIVLQSRCLRDATGVCMSNSSITNIIIMYGIFAMLFFAYYYVAVAKGSAIKDRFFSVLYLIASYSAAFPLIWLLPSLNVSRKKSG